eukprot:1337746-Rhodomonas_salina.1
MSNICIITIVTIDNISEDQEGKEGMAGVIEGRFARTQESGITPLHLRKVLPQTPPHCRLCLRCDTLGITFCKLVQPGRIAMQMASGIAAPSTTA